MKSASFYKLLGDVYSNLQYEDLAKSAYLFSYQKNPHLFSVRKALHHLGVYVEDMDEQAAPSPLLQSIQSLGKLHARLIRHQPVFATSSPLSYYYQFRSQYDNAQYLQAMRSFRSLQQLLPWWTKGLDTFSSVLYVEKQKGELEALLVKANLVIPSSKETAVIRGNLASLRGDANTLELLSAVTMSYPFYAYGFQLLGDEHLLRGDAEHAFDAFRKALRLSPKDHRIWLGLGDCYSLQRDFGRAQCHYEQALSLFPSCVSAECRLIQSLLQQGNTQKAQQLLHSALTDHPDDVKLLLQQAQLYKSQKQWKRAVATYERVVLRTTLEVSTYIDMAQCYHELGDLAESKRILFLASKMDSQNQHAIMVLVGRVYES